MPRLRISDDCVLRPIRKDDADELHALIEANRPRLRPWMPWAEQDRQATVEFVESAIRQERAKDGFQAAVVAGDTIAGVVGFHRIRWHHRSTSMGYWLGEEHEGRGLMTRSVTALIELAFSDWQLNRIEIRVAPENDRSRAIPKRLGFAEEGVLHQYERIGDRFLDHVMYAMLRENWRGPVAGRGT
jgi:ribosomal-protein-serine acetyltransferase